MSYAYVRAYANDALWAELVARQAVTPIERFEAESLRVVARHLCPTNPQDMAEHGGPLWGGGRQLFCRASRGGFVVLGLPVRRSGRYRVSLRATAAPDYGKIQAALDDKSVGPVFDLYSGRVCPSGTLDLGVVDLVAGSHALRVAAVGKDPASGNVFFGLDSVELAAPE
jgi:hypothetical protein